jgi:hypothetical protein
LIFFFALSFSLFSGSQDLCMVFPSSVFLPVSGSTQALIAAGQGGWHGIERHDSAA